MPQQTCQGDDEVYPLLSCITERIHAEHLGRTGHFGAHARVAEQLSRLVLFAPEVNRAYPERNPAFSAPDRNENPRFPGLRGMDYRKSTLKAISQNDRKFAAKSMR